MAEKELALCDECGSLFFKGSSQMMGLCPECAHILYGYPNCDHHFQDGRCVNCYMDMREMFTIDGRRFSNMAGFYDEVEQVFICGLDWKIGRNLNAFNDILRGGFGRHEYGQPIHIQWLAYEKSVRNLGKETMDTIVEIILDTDHSGHDCTLERL